MLVTSWCLWDAWCSGVGGEINALFIVAVMIAALMMSCVKELDVDVESTLLLEQLP